jgi:predicted RecB family nuclease
MRFKVTDVYDYYRPSECRLRVYLRHHRVEEGPPGPFQGTLRRLGQAHERRELATFGDVVDLSALEPDAKEQRTLESIRAGASCVYQGRFTARLDLDGEECEIVGEPDFLVRTGEGYVIRDSKLARRIDEESHPEILLQLQLYGWLFEQKVGVAPAGLEVHAGDDRLVPIPYDGGASARERLEFLCEARLEAAEFYEPVGWSKCGGCGYRERCWTRAESANEIALLPAVSQKWARRLHGRGVTDIHGLSKAFERADLRDLFFDRATKKKPEQLKPGAARIRRTVEAHEAAAAVTLGAVELPDTSSAIMLDFEGMPPYLDEIEKVYLWGFKDFRGEPARYLAAQAGLGLDGDREGWEDFLRIAAGLLAEQPDMSFVHYGNYERVKIDLYRRRYEDPSGTAEILLQHLFDVHRATTDAVVLPVYSYSLKVVERFVGFTRQHAEANAEWAMARYIEATESGSAEERARVLDEVMAYNEEDLDATRAVLEWLRRQQEIDLPGDPPRA